MTNLENFNLSPEDPKFAGNQRNIAMVAIFGPAIAGESAIQGNEDTACEQAPIKAVHSAISSILMREFPEAVEKRGLDKAIEEFDDGCGMRGGFPTPTSWTYDGRDYYQVIADAIAEGRASHRNAMMESRYTVTLGQAARALQPYIEAFDDKSKEMFDEVFPHGLSRAFGSVWEMLLKQDTHVERFSGVMSWQYRGLNQPYAELPEEPGEGLYDDYLNQRFVMTEADIHRIFSEPIANAFQKNVDNNGRLKLEVSNPQDDALV